MSIENLINAIASGSAIETEQAFNSVMAEKISARLDDMRVEVAQNMFQTEAVEEIEEELTLEDYSAEEIEEFMQTEDYEQLDELSKKTLGDYVKKASNDVGYKSSLITRMAHKMGSEKDKYLNVNDSDYSDDVKDTMKKQHYDKINSADKLHTKAELTLQKRKSGIAKAVDKLTK